MKRYRRLAWHSKDDCTDLCLFGPQWLKGVLQNRLQFERSAVSNMAAGAFCSRMVGLLVLLLAHGALQLQDMWPGTNSNSIPWCAVNDNHWGVKPMDVVELAKDNYCMWSGFSTGNVLRHGSWMVNYEPNRDDQMALLAPKSRACDDAEVTLLEQHGPVCNFDADSFSGITTVGFGRLDLINYVQCNSGMF